MEAKIRRQLAMADARKGLILDAARVAFSRLGLERTSMREIAKQAGYTVGALYAYFSSKQELLSALLEEMTGRLQTAVLAARPPKGHPEHMLLARGQAWLTFFISQPHDMELMLYLLAGIGTQRAQADIGRRVHSQIRKTLEPMGEALLASGATPGQLDGELEALLAQGVGLLMAQDTNRLQAPEQSPEALFARYLQDLLNRYQAEVQASVTGAADKAAAPQVDLFR
ncbi:MAG: TetR/AcrR family transcriptional regulator [Burkholderiales bacterium]|nr:TetR/AcrR family transcriptional regulator [Burkholderiales bacterium]